MAITKQELTEYFRKMGQKGGQAKRDNMTPEERSAYASKIAKIRWSKQKKLNQEK